MNQANLLRCQREGPPRLLLIDPTTSAFHTSALKSKSASPAQKAKAAAKSTIGRGFPASGGSGDDEAHAYNLVRVRSGLPQHADSSHAVLAAALVDSALPSLSAEALR
jgi:hypothetical protein